MVALIFKSHEHVIFIGNSVMITEIVYRFCQYFCIKGSLWTKHIVNTNNSKALYNTNFPMLSMAGSIWFLGRYIPRYQNLTWIVFRWTPLIPAREGEEGEGRKKERGRQEGRRKQFISTCWPEQALEPLTGCIRPNGEAGNPATLPDQKAGLLVAH